MLANIKLLGQYMRPNTGVRNVLRNISLTSKRYTEPNPTEKPEIIDIDFESMMRDDDDDDFSSDGILPEHQPSGGELPTIQSTDIDGAPIAPVDIDAWVDEDEAKQGTVNSDIRKLFEYPPIPEKRSNVFTFQGIKVVLPKKMIQPQTYRYRLDNEALASLADDIRVCKFDKKPNKPRPDEL